MKHMHSHIEVLGYSSLFPVGSKSVSTRPGMHSFFLFLCVCVFKNPRSFSPPSISESSFSVPTPMRVLISLKSPVSPPSLTHAWRNAGCIVVLNFAPGYVAQVRSKHLRYLKAMISIRWHIKQVHARLHISPSHC